MCDIGNVTRSRPERCESGSRPCEQLRHLRWWQKRPRDDSPGLQSAGAAATPDMAEATSAPLRAHELGSSIRSPESPRFTPASACPGESFPAARSQQGALEVQQGQPRHRHVIEESARGPAPADPFPRPCTSPRELRNNPVSR
jgi:hypothetical protein